MIIKLLVKKHSIKLQIGTMKKEKQKDDFEL